MPITYRTPGDWGPGKGSNLTASEVDNNFWEIIGRLTSLEENPVEGVSIADITMAGTFMTVHMSDGSEFGPFEIPVNAFHWRGDWQPDTLYATYDVFRYNGVVYLSLDEHTSPEVFDPDLESTEGPVLAPMVESGGGGGTSISVANIGDTVFALGTSHAGMYLRTTNENPVTIQVPDNATDPIPVGSIYQFRQAGWGQVSFQPMGAAFIESPASLSLAGPGASGRLIKVEADRWDLSGELSWEPPSSEGPIEGAILFAGTGSGGQVGFDAIEMFGALDGSPLVDSPIVDALCLAWSNAERMQDEWWLSVILSGDRTTSFDWTPHVIKIDGVELGVTSDSDVIVDYLAGPDATLIDVPLSGQVMFNGNNYDVVLTPAGGGVG